MEISYNIFLTSCIMFIVFLIIVVFSFRVASKKKDCEEDQNPWCYSDWKCQVSDMGKTKIENVYDERFIKWYRSCVAMTEKDVIDLNATCKKACEDYCSSRNLPGDQGCINDCETGTNGYGCAINSDGNRPYEPGDINWNSCTQASWMR